MPALYSTDGPMSDDPVTVPVSAARFFNNYLECLCKASIPERQRRWYVKHIEDFIKAQNGRRIKSLSRSDLTEYLEMIGRQNHLKDWQYRQCVNAIRILYCDLLLTPAGKEVDWNYWIESASELEPEHPTNAHQYTPEELSWLKTRRGNGPP